MTRIRRLVVAVLSLSLFSCSVETMNNNELFQGQNPNALISGRLVYEKNLTAVNAQTQRIKYTADLTNALNEIPVFANETMNHEISRMKWFIQKYIYAVRSNNSKQERRYYNDYVAIYRKIQLLKKKMNKDEALLLQSYLNRVKANINSIEYLS